MRILSTLTAVSLALHVGVVAGQTQMGRTQLPNTVQVSTVRVAEGVYVLVGVGGNIGVLDGPDGVLLVDAGGFSGRSRAPFTPLAAPLKAALRTITHRPIRFVVNTHFHNDHQGGNRTMGEDGALIVVHETVWRRSSERASWKALPVLSFTQTVILNLNGERVQVFGVDSAHTTTDVIVHFPTSNVIHMGDLYFSGIYPFVHVSAGGSIDGVIRAVSLVLERIDEQTKVIPGHGRVSSKAELQAYRDMLITVRERVRRLIAQGKSRDEVIAATPTADLDETWGRGSVVFPDGAVLHNGNWFAAILYDDLSRTRLH